MTGKLKTVSNGMYTGQSQVLGNESICDYDRYNSKEWNVYMTVRVTSDKI